MSIGLNASQARSNSRQDMIIFDETQAIMREIIERSASGYYDAFISDNTVMTESTPVTEITCSVSNPTIIIGSTVVINGSTILLGATSSNLNGIIADINDANVPGVTATKNENNQLVLIIEHPQQSTWQYEIGTGTANTTLGLSSGLYTVTSPASTSYFDVWQGVTTDRSKAQQMESIIRYFSNLGYKIERTTNTVTSKTFKWFIYW